MGMGDGGPRRRIGDDALRRLRADAVLAVGVTKVKGFQRPEAGRAPPAEGGDESSPPDNFARVTPPR